MGDCISTSWEYIWGIQVHYSARSSGFLSNELLSFPVLNATLAFLLKVKFLLRIFFLFYTRPDIFEFFKAKLKFTPLLIFPLGFK